MGKVINRKRLFVLGIILTITGVAGVILSAFNLKLDWTWFIVGITSVSSAIGGLLLLDDSI